MKLKHLVLALALICSAFVQGQNYIGTEFRFAFLKNLNPLFNTPPIFEASIHAIDDLEATVEYGDPADAFYQVQNISLDAGEVGVVSFDQDEFLNQETLNVVETRSFTVTTTGNARVYAFHNRLFFADSSPVLPTSSLGSDYLVISFEESGGSAPSLFNIIGTEDGTQVSVTPTSATLLGGAGDTYTLELDAGEVITISSSGDLTGSRVTSEGAPFAVFAGHQQSIIGLAGCGADSHMFEQMIPLSDWGTVHPIFPIGGNDGDLFRVLAVNDNTQLFNGCDLITTLDAGEFFEEFYEDPFVLVSNEPVSVTAYTRGGDCSGNNTGDPNMRLLLPLDQGNTDLKLRVENPLQDGGIFGSVVLHVLHFVMPTADTGDLTLNGNTLTNWATFPDVPEMSYVEIGIPDIDNQFNVLSDSPFWAELISLKSFDAFTMSMGSSDIIELPPLEFLVVDLGADQSICPGEIIVLDPGLSLSGTWQDGSTQETFTVTEPGIYSVTIDDGCGDGTAEVEISPGFVPSPELPVEQIICEGDELQLEVNPESDVTYEWNTGETGPSIEVIGFGTFTVVATSADNCEATASTNVIDGATAEVTITGPESLCEDEVVDLIASSDTEGVFVWDDGTIGSSLSIDEGGSYRVSFTPEIGCEVTSEISIGQVQLPFILVDDAEKCEGDPVQVGASSPNGDVFWPDFSENVVAEITQAGLYEVSAENECGISSRFVQITDRDCSCPVYVPNVFTPNGDGLNDIFQPDILCEPETYELIIFNRWGREVFSTNDFNQSWNGDSKTNDEFFSPESTYTYILRYDNPLRPLQQTVEVSGLVTIIR